ncbi:MAG: Ig-like domain-containing protein, partial [Clostridia bacterium]|nr:Ig-like domain-containing protein [Clostridia bacterium]
ALIWESSDESVATVDQSGKVTAVAEGTALITVKTSSERFIERCVVEVGDFKEELPAGSANGPSPVIFIVIGAVLAAAAVVVIVLVIRKNKAKKN